MYEQERGACEDASVLILGFTFKENCPDIRNTKVADIYHTLTEYTSNITVCDPHADADKVMSEYGISLVKEMPSEKFDAIVLAVAHEEFRSINVSNLKKNSSSVVYDVKGVWKREDVDGRL